MSGDVPVVAFYSIQGGVGKSTLARKFAELITIAPGRSGHKPNVLLVDLDIDSRGLTFRLKPVMPLGQPTVHQMIASKHVAGATAARVTQSVSLSGGNPANRGELFLVPAAPEEAKSLYKQIGAIPSEELLRLFKDMIDGLIMDFQLSCVVIDCSPGASPHTAAAATLADVPFLIGRNEDATFKQIRSLPEQFREWYPQFQSNTQRVIINAVSVKALYEARAQQFPVFDYIPLVSDVIHETEGLPHSDSLRQLLFEKYVVDIIRQVFMVDHPHLVPEAPEVLGEEWVETLTRLERCEEAPRMKRLRRLRHLRWIGAGLLAIGVVLVGARTLFDNLPDSFNDVGIASLIIGPSLIAVGWYVESSRQRVLAMARKLIIEGPDGVFEKLKEGATHRKELSEMKKLADSIPPEARAREAAPKRQPSGASPSGQR